MTVEFDGGESDAVEWRHRDIGLGISGQTCRFAVGWNSTKIDGLFDNVIGYFCSRACFLLTWIGCRLEHLDFNRRHFENSYSSKILLLIGMFYFGGNRCFVDSIVSAGDWMIIGIFVANFLEKILYSELDCLRSYELFHLSRKIAAPEQQDTPSPLNHHWLIVLRPRN